MKKCTHESTYTNKINYDSLQNYPKFRDGFSKIATPLNQLLKKDVQFNWSEKQQEAFQFLKGKLCEEPLFQRQDCSQPFILTTGAPGFAIINGN